MYMEKLLTLKMVWRLLFVRYPTSSQNSAQIPMEFYGDSQIMQPLLGKKILFEVSRI